MSESISQRFDFYKVFTGMYNLAKGRQVEAHPWLLGTRFLELWIVFSLMVAFTILFLPVWLYEFFLHHLLVLLMFCLAYVGFTWWKMSGIREVRFKENLSDYICQDDLKALLPEGLTLGEEEGVALFDALRGLIDDKDGAEACENKSTGQAWVRENIGARFSV